MIILDQNYNSSLIRHCDNHCGIQDSSDHHLNILIQNENEIRNSQSESYPGDENKENYHPLCLPLMVIQEDSRSIYGGKTTENSDFAGNGEMQEGPIKEIS